MSEIGVDITRIERFEKMKNKDRFIKRVLTDREREYYEMRGESDEVLAGLFAGKEAVSKVTGLGLKIGLKNVSIEHEKSGKPYALWYKDGKIYQRFAISIAHDGAYAVAIAKGRGMEKNLIYVDDIAQILLKRDLRGHKGNYGRLGILGGSEGMTGAIAMASDAAQRSGSGVVHAIIPKSCQTAISLKINEVVSHPIEDEGEGIFLNKYTPEILQVLDRMDALVIGPGMGRGEDVFYILKTILDNFHKPILIDADGLYSLSRDSSIIKKIRTPIVITPHEMEMARLVKKGVDEVKKNRVDTAQTFAQEYRVTVLLKGHETVITENDSVFYLNPTGNPGMATAGSGDVLSGVIGSFLGQGYDALNATRLGAYVHGLAGDLASYDLGEDGMIASDIIERIPLALKFIHEENEKRFKNS